MNKWKLILVLTAFNFAIVSTLPEYAGLLNAEEKKTLETKFPNFSKVMNDFFNHLGVKKPDENALQKDLKSLKELNMKCESLELERIKLNEDIQDEIPDAIKGGEKNIRYFKSFLNSFALKLINGMCDKMAPLNDSQIAELNKKYPEFLKSALIDVDRSFGEGFWQEQFEKAMEAFNAKYECEALKADRDALKKWITDNIAAAAKAYNEEPFPRSALFRYELIIKVHEYGLKLLNGECVKKPVTEKNPKPTLC